MPKPKTLLISLAAGVALAILVLTLAKPGEPSYEGHSLSYWLKQAASGSEDAETAVRTIGTNAIPLLVRWINYEPPALRKKLALLAMEHHRNKLFYLLAGEERMKADIGFEILGTNAAPALPALVNIVTGTPSADLYSAIVALGNLGPQALPFLTNELSNTNWSRRRSVLESIARLPFHGTPTNACLIPLLSATMDPDPRVRRAATTYIERLAPQALTNPPLR